MVNISITVTIFHYIRKSECTLIEYLDNVDKEAKVSDGSEH